MKNSTHKKITILIKPSQCFYASITPWPINNFEWTNLLHITGKKKLRANKPLLTNIGCFIIVTCIQFGQHWESDEYTRFWTSYQNIKIQGKICYSLKIGSESEKLQQTITTANWNIFTERHAYQLDSTNFIYSSILQFGVMPLTTQRDNHRWKEYLAFF